MKIKDIEINFLEYGKKSGKNIIFLHGWGQNIEMMKPLGDYFSLNNYVYVLDLPGFGESEEPSITWEIKDYTEMLEMFIKENKIRNPIIVGHSFGGRIAIDFASRNKLKKLVLFASPFEVKQKMSLKTKILKLLKKIPLLNKLENFAKNHIGSTDYKKASPVMKQILVNTVNTDLTEQAQQISVPTLLIWGTNDTAVSLNEGKRLQSLIKNSALIEYENGSHYAYLEQISKTNLILTKFIESEEEK